MSSFSFSSWSNLHRTKFEESLYNVFGEADKGTPNIYAACAYPLQTGGKRIRPLFVYAAAQAFGTYDEHSALCSALSIELIHTYSLVHDDLPCMDDDDERRGLPTVHKKYGEAPALLVGDALLTKAFAILCGSPHLSQTLPIISEAAGIAGMIGGQSMDIGFEGTMESIEQISLLHKKKTGALIKAATLLGGISAEASLRELMALESYGTAIGLAFQLADDVLDAEEDSDADGPPSFVKFLGIEETQKKAQECHQAALLACAQLPHPEALIALADFTIDRNH